MLEGDVRTASSVKSPNDIPNSWSKWQLGAAWVFAKSWTEVAERVNRDARIVATEVGRFPISQYSFVATLARKNEQFKWLGGKYCAFIANYTCAIGICEKLLCSRLKEGIYTAFVATARSEEVRKKLDEIMSRLLETGVVDTNGLKEPLFKGAKGSYYWTQSLLDHLVFLDVATRRSNNKYVIK